MRIVRASTRVVRRPLACVALLALAHSAHAQQFPSCPLSTQGPDVICGDLTGVMNYNTANGMDAVALGTTSCNVGNAELNWIPGTVNHPLMGSQVYKYSVVAGASRFESLGQSWLKHAFVAVSGNLCCPCTSSGTGQRLGVGCSDTYGASSNGSVSNLGPKYQVNPHTGTYVAPPPHPSGGNNGRVQILLGELAPSSANVRYFGEMAYVALDDAQSNNNDNNVSYKELTCVLGSGSAGFTFAQSGATARMLPAIHAWQLVDPAVALTTIDVPEDSSPPYDGTARVILASRVTDLGGGTWHYEYALYNQNSERAIAAFSVPVSHAANVTNIGFRDVPYFGGDGLGGVDFDGTDWTSSHAGDVLTWSTTPFATNPSSNALRWESAYNFRFDADVGPASGTVTLGQYKVVNDVLVTGIDVPSDPSAFASFCSNDTLGVDHTTTCPCGNNGAAGNGCAHSFDAGGANLAATGTAALDDVVLSSSSTPSASFTLFLQHAAIGDTIFHDGVLCAGGTLIRLRGRNAAGGSATFPDSTFAQDVTLTLAQRGGVTPGSGARRYYSAWYRNASSSFCPPATANVTNGWVVDW
jgi:hypothetical protein